MIVEREVLLNTPYKRKRSDPEINSGEFLLDIASYVPAKVQLKNLIESGERLKLAREEMYHFPREEDVDEDFEDPTMTPGFDMSDASQMLSDLEEKKKKDEKIRRKALQSKKKDDKVVPSKSKDGDENDSEGERDDQ